MWISTKDALPQQNVPVFACGIDLEPAILSWNGAVWETVYATVYNTALLQWETWGTEPDQYQVTHWHPFPDAPYDWLMERS
jgi:hypothetical protein